MSSTSGLSNTFLLLLKKSSTLIFSPRKTGGKILTPDWAHCLLALLNWIPFLKVFGFPFKENGLAIIFLRFSQRYKRDGGNEFIEWFLGIGTMV